LLIKSLVFAFHFNVPSIYRVIRNMSVFSLQRHIYFAQVPWGRQGPWGSNACKRLAACHASPTKGIPSLTKNTHTPLAFFFYEPSSLTLITRFELLRHFATQLVISLEFGGSTTTKTTIEITRIASVDRVSPNQPLLFNLGDINI